MNLNLTVSELHIHIQHATIKVQPDDTEALKKIQELQQQVVTDTTDMQATIDQSKE